MSRRMSGSPVTTPPRLASQQPYLSWTDDLPVCYLSGVGFATNQIYREDGFRQEEHEFEDRVIHFRTEDNISLYGVFDGHEGHNVSHFAAQRMPAELLLGQLRDKTNIDEIKSILRDSIISVDSGYMESVDDLLAQKASLTLRIPENLTEYEALQQYPEIFQQLESLNSKLIGGSTAVVALVYNDRLYTANVGCSRALLCQQDSQGILRVVQLSEDHDLDNLQEVERLQGLGADIQVLKEQGKVGSFRYTRSLGDLDIKLGYRTFPGLGQATTVPLISEPFVTDGIDIDECRGFLILMSYGLYKSLEDALTREDGVSAVESVNATIAMMVATEFAVQSTLNGVTQAVVDKVVRYHHDTFIASTGTRKETCRKRKDITLLVRNFNYPLPNALSSPSSASNISPLVGTGTNMEKPLSVIIPQTSPTDNRFQPYIYSSGGRTLTHGSSYSTTYSTNDSTQSTQSNMDILFNQKTTSKPKLDLDADGKVAPYVDFADFSARLEALTLSEREQFNKDTTPRPDYEPIPEDKELVLHEEEAASTLDVEADFDALSQNEY